MAAGDIIVEGDSGREFAVVEIPTASTPPGVAKIRPVALVDAVTGLPATLGGGTEYTEDAAAAANPVGKALILVRRDTLTVAEVTTDGDNVAAKATSKGEIYTHDSDVLAKLPTVGTAGSASANVISIQGIASMTAVKVDLIAAQTGITAGAGAVAANTPRITLASDDPAVVSLGVMDDWDESDRAKANIIVGQAGVAAGAGAVGATVQRMTLASDDPLVARIPSSVGPKTPALSLSVIQAVLTPFAKAAGLTASPFGATGAGGDYLSHVILQPAAVGAGTTTIFNNATAVYVYTAGTLADLRPIVIPINALSVGGSWNITTGANMAATGFGTFT